MLNPVGYLDDNFPFKGIVERPYSQKLLEGIYRHDIFPQTMVMRDLWLTQNKLTVTGMLGAQKFSTDSYPHIVEWQGSFYVEDGHHRLVLNVLHGHTIVNVRLIRLGEPVMYIQ